MTRTFTPPPPTTEEIERICLDATGSMPSAVTTLRSGAWSNAFGLETSAGPMVLRFSKTGDDFRADEVASAFATPDLPIPRVHAMGQLDERYWCLSQRMPGVHLDELDADQMREVLPSLAGMLRAMREVDASGTTGFGGWDANGNGMFATFADQLLDVAVDTPGERGGGWSERLATHTRGQQVFDAGVWLLDELSQFVPESRQLIHQDTINFNVTVDNGRISGIFDWGCAMWGDALYDIAWFGFWDPWYPQWSSLNLPNTLLDLVGAEGDHVAKRIRCYLLHIGVMHIRYNAFIENERALNEVVGATANLIKVAMR